MPYIVETCGPEGWQTRVVKPTRAEAYAALDALIKSEKWGTLSIRVQSAPLRAVR
jgi:hypothetical protein